MAATTIALTSPAKPLAGELTLQHNIEFAQPDAAEVSARLLASHSDLRHD